MTLRNAARAALSTKPASWLVSLLEHLYPRGSNVLAVLTYHRIAQPALAGAQTALYVPPHNFEEHLDALTPRYEVISMGDVLDAHHGRLRLPRRALLLTFDDAYLDFETNAWPMLRARSLPATLFVPTGYPDQPERWFWWDRLGEVLAGSNSASTIATPLGELPVATSQERDGAYRQLRDHCKQVGLEASIALVAQIADELGAAPPRNDVLGWDALRRLAGEGVTIAPHSVSHALMPALSDDELAFELASSRSTIERELGTSATSFAYPSGAWDQRVVEATAAAGFEVAFTTRRGVNDLRRVNPLTMRRVNVGHRTRSTLLRAQVGSWMTLVGHD